MPEASAPPNEEGKVNGGTEGAEGRAGRGGAEGVGGGVEEQSGDSSQVLDSSGFNISIAGEPGDTRYISYFSLLFFVPILYRICKIEKGIYLNIFYLPFIHPN